MAKIFYNAAQNVAELDSYSPSAGKPARLINHLNDLYPVQSNFRPVSIHNLHLAHSPDYVGDVFTGITLNGFENKDPRVPQSCLWNIGSLYAAALEALHEPAVPVCSPSSGYHHAHHAFGGGFCTFNGLMVVALALLESTPEIKIGVLDCDFHYGDGTTNILSKIPVHQSAQILHITQGKSFYGDDKRAEQRAFQKWLPESIAKLNSFGCDLVLYQAGADPHIDDPLGGFLTSQQLAHRDYTVFATVHAPIAWCLAGGYQPPRADGTDPVLEIHAETLRQAERSVPRRRALLQDLEPGQDIVRAAFHAYAQEHEGWGPLTTPAPGFSYSGAHAQMLWECFRYAYKLGANK